MSTSRNSVIQIREPGSAAEFRVVYDGRLCAPVWEKKGPAFAYLNAVVRGQRSPEYERKETTWTQTA